jgi:hypothetical protein
MDESPHTQPVEIAVEHEHPGPVAARRRRAVTGIVAAMLVAGSGGLGFGLGRSVSDDGGAPAAEPPTTGAGTLAPATTGGPATAPSTAPPSTVAESVAPPTAAADGGQVAARIDEGWYPGAGPLDLVWEGATDDGVRLRLLLGPTIGDPGGVGPGGWQPAAFCYGTGQMRLTVDGPDVVDVVYGSWYTEMYGRTETVFVGDVGVADGRPMRIAVVQATDDVSAVTVEYEDGTSATAPVEAGAAVLVSEVTGVWPDTFTFELALADGSTESVGGGYQSRDSDPAWRTACLPPPPALPPAGEQPPDPDAARAEIEARFALLWDRTIDRADKPLLLDDDTGVDDAVAALDAGAYADTADTAVFTIDELVFTAPDRAWFRYTIDTDVSVFAGRYGVARLAGDGWIFPRALMCQDLGLAGANCEPESESIYPPSWYEQFGQQCNYAETGMAEDCVGYEESAIADW